MIVDIFKRIAKQVVREGISSVIKRVLKRKPTKAPPDPKSTPSPQAEFNKEHPWRRCGEGRHWVTTHSLTVHASGDKVPRTGHCASNPSRKKGAAVPYFMKSDEAAYIRDTYFGGLESKLPKGKFPKFGHADAYDEIIQGWTQYWNEVFNPWVALDPTVIKALILSESGSKLDPGTPNAGVGGKARGLIQLTDQTIRVLGDPDGELKDHLIKMTPAEASDPNVSVCAGIRWLFHKKRLAAGKLGRDATWDEAIADYKGYLNGMIRKSGSPTLGLEHFHEFLKELKK